jgi:hypothetical protein
MHFQITHAHWDEQVEDGEVVFNTVDVFQWKLIKADGVVCQSARSFDNEPACRSDIAKAKTAMKGASRCKVLSPDA